ncbi:MAG: HAD family hydrolase, partial [Kiritimatiellae bacterium]|nr:HAD family hydrolase [Kiritimatiellia bacterium]
ACRARGLRVGIGTDMSAIEQFRKLETLGLLDLVDFVATSEEAGVEKPHPGFFDLVVEKSRCAPGEILFVGDNLRKDALGASAAEMRGVWLQPDPAAREAHPEVASVASLPDLLALLRRLRRRGGVC